MLDTLKAITPGELANMKAAIGNAEKRTSGEIRVFIEDRSKDDPLDRAAFLFQKIGIGSTVLRNGVLIYVALKDHKFSIIGDKGIHEKVGPGFWDAIKEKMTEHFRAGRIYDGIVTAVTDAGEALADHFPYTAGDRNELSDDIIFGEPEG
jgi:uncharacterized membrane protein